MAFNTRIYELQLTHSQCRLRLGLAARRSARATSCVFRLAAVLAGRDDHDAQREAAEHDARGLGLGRRGEADQEHADEGELAP